MKDSKATAGTAAVDTNGTVTGASGADFTGYNVGDFLQIGSNDYVFTGIAGATGATVRQADGSNSIPASTAAAFTVSEKPLSVVYSENLDAAEVYGADPTEVGVTGATQGDAIVHAGWVKRTVGTGGRDGRVTFETLVASGSITGDAEDTILPDS